MFKRKILAVFLALSSMFSLSATAHAEEAIESKQTVKIGDYDCWVENGEYYTEIDGEVGLVINLADLPKRPINDVELLANNELDWEHNNMEIDITDNREYNGVITLRKADDYTPIFRIDTGIGGHASFKFKTNHVSANEYKVTAHTYDSQTGEWNYGYKTTIVFSLFHRYVLFVDGSNTPNISKCCVYFHKDGSPGSAVFNYTAQQVQYT